MSLDSAPKSASEPSFLRDLWYMTGLSSRLAPGAMRRDMLLGEPVLVGRTHDGKIFAMRDICPHRGVPLSAGKILSENTVECPYHGWRFKSDGVCSTIPSLVEEQTLDPGKIRVRHYPVSENDGLIWIYMASPGRENESPRSQAPRVPVLQAKPRWTETQTFQCDIDHAVIGLMDPAHARYVHDHWWWKRPLKRKDKHYAPLATGFTMSPHRPSKAAYGVLGGSNVTTEITFELPSTRFEIVTGRILGRDVKVVGLTVCTPRDAENTDVTQVFYWPTWLFFIKPFFWAVGRTFIADDRKIVELQREGLKFNPTLMLIQDSDMPAIWYHRVKKAWTESVEKGTEFVNPVQERTLHWKS